MICCVTRRTRHALYLLVLVILSSCQSPLVAPAIKQVEKHGGAVSWEYSPKWVGFHNYAKPTPIDDAEFQQIQQSLRWFWQLETLDMTATSITDASMPRIAQLRTLRCVLLAGTGVTPTGVLELRRLPRLRYVAVSAKAFASEDVERLREAMPSVEVERQVTTKGDPPQ